MQIMDTNGITLYNSDDDGYERNSFISFNSTYNQTIKIRVFLYGDDYDAGWFKVSIIPAYSCLENGCDSFSMFSDILNISTDGLYKLYSYASINYMNVVTFRPKKDGYCAIYANSEFDNCLYLIDPTSSNLLVEDKNYNDEYYEDDHNAYLCEKLSSTKTYLIIFGQSDISYPFANLDDGDDITITFSLFNV